MSKIQEELEFLDSMIKDAEMRLSEVKSWTNMPEDFKAEKINFWTKTLKDFTTERNNFFATHAIQE